MWRYFESRKRHGEDPEVIERPIGTTILYVVLFFSGLGTVGGLIPMAEDCKMVCSGTHHFYPLAVVSATVGVIAAGMLAWFRWQERRGRTGH